MKHSAGTLPGYIVNVIQYNYLFILIVANNLTTLIPRCIEKEKNIILLQNFRFYG